MATEWYYVKNGEQFGPVSAGDLKKSAATGHIQPTDLVWKEGMADWVSASKVKGLFPAASISSPQFPEKHVATHTPAKTKAFWFFRLLSRRSIGGTAILILVGFITIIALNFGNYGDNSLGDKWSLIGTFQVKGDYSVMALSPDGQKLAIRDSDKVGTRIHIHDLNVSPHTRLNSPVEIPAKKVYTLAFSGTSEWIAWDDLQNIYVWDIEKKQEVGHFPNAHNPPGGYSITGPDGKPFQFFVPASIYFSPASQTCITASEIRNRKEQQRQIKVWSTTNWKQLYDLEGQKPASVSADGKLLAFVNSTKSAVIVWDLIDRRTVQKIEIGNDAKMQALGVSTSSVAVAPAQRFGTGKSYHTNGHEVQLYDVSDSVKKRQIPIATSWKKGGIRCLAISGDGNTLVLAGGSKWEKVVSRSYRSTTSVTFGGSAVYVWDLPTSTFSRLRHGNGDLASVNDVSLSKDGSVIAYQFSHGYTATAQAWKRTTDHGTNGYTDWKSYVAHMEQKLQEIIEKSKSR